MSPSRDDPGLAAAWMTHAFLCVSSVLAVAPIALAVMAAFKTPMQLAAGSPVTLPDPWTLSAFRDVLEGRSDLGRAFLITAATVALLLCVQLPLSFAAACALTFELPPRARRVLLGIVVSAFLVPATVLIVPQYLIISVLGLTETFLGLIVPFLLGSPWAVFLFRQSLRSIPGELYDAARMDGVGPLGILVRIMVPLSRGPILAVSLVTIVTQWNAFLWPLVASGTRWPVLTVATAGLQNQQGTHVSAVMAGAVLSLMPVIVLLLTLHRPFGRVLISRSGL